MDPLSNADRFVALLRQKLEERERTQRKAAKPAVAPLRAPPRGIETVRQVASGTARAGADDRRLRRTIVEQLLADRFGASLVNEVKFQAVVEQVSEIMAADPELGALLDEVMIEVRR